jgi:membrane protease YdiL (CAAX protease family)
VNLRTVFIKDHRLRPGWRVLAYIVTTLAGAELLLRLTFAVSPALRSATGLGAAILGETCLAASVVGIGFAFRAWLDRRPLASLGLTLGPSSLSLFAIGTVFGAGMQLLAAGVGWLAGSVRVTGFAPLTSDLRYLPPAAGVLLIAALAEEFSMRGYMLQNFREAWGRPAAAVATAIIFALAHLGNPHSHGQLILTLAGLFLFGIWAAYSVFLTGSLWLVLGAHVAWNLFEGPLLGLPVSGLSMPFPTALRETGGGPDWLTGGSFGPEAGVSSLVALGVGLVVLRLLALQGLLGPRPAQPGEE